MKWRIVWRKFYWQKFGRFWLYYYEPRTGGWRHTDVSKFLVVRSYVQKYQGESQDE